MQTRPSSHALPRAWLRKAFAIAALACTEAIATDPLSEYRSMLADDNPAELAVARGEELWKMPRGPRNASLAGCDLGKGPGVLSGAYAALPRHFADTGSVMDLESRLVHCMGAVQGLAPAGATAAPVSEPRAAQNDPGGPAAYVAGPAPRGTVRGP